MPYRWILCPVITTPLPGGGVGREPKVMTIPDPGRPPIATVDDDGTPITVPIKVSMVAAISAGQPGQTNDWCLCRVEAVDFSLVAADPECVDLFEAMEYTTVDNRLVQTPRAIGWSAARTTRLASRLSARGISTAGLTRDTPLVQWVERAASKVNPKFRATR